MTTEAEARAELLAAGPNLNIVTIRQSSSSVAEGDVISMSPGVGTKVGPTATVTLFVSSGPFPATRWTGTFPEVVDAAVSVAPYSGASLITCFVDLDIPGDRARLNDSGCTLEWDGHEWLGLGRFGSIAAISESLEVFAQPVILTLSGVENEWITAARETQYKGRDVSIYMGVFNTRTVELLDEPEELWSGYMDFMECKFGKSHGSIQLHCEHRMRQGARVYRWTDESQRARFAGDLGFQHLWRIRKDVGKWGTRDLSYGGSGAKPTSGPVRNKD